MIEHSGFSKRNFPRRVLLILLGLWLTSAFWFFSAFGIGL